MKNRFIRVIGFEPTTEESQFLQLKLSQVQDEAPSQASISIELEKESGLFKGIAQIFFGGPSAPISAKAESKTLEDMVQDLSQKIRDQIKIWKQERFSGEGV